MQGFPPGWVDGLTRTAALRCLGNAVVPQVAERFGRMIQGDRGGSVVPLDTLLPTPNASPCGPNGQFSMRAVVERMLLPTPTATYGGGTAEMHVARKNSGGGNRTSVTDLGMVIEQVLR